MQETAKCLAIMHDYAQSTGLVDGSAAPRRYLWTDAFAVCNFLGLYRLTGRQIHLDSARRLVDQVHFVLGRYADNDWRSGWISGLDEQAGYEHPTAGGLRIGKKLPERQAHEAFDDRLEWERDGQYLHYLTKWMQALTRMAMVTGETRYHRWALELARAAHAGFTYRPMVGPARRMYWKMSVDLSRPLVTSMGQHDPLDALVAYLEIRANGIPDGDSGEGTELGDELGDEIADCQAMCAGRGWATDDPLGTGGLLADTFCLAQLPVGADWWEPLKLSSLLADCLAGVAAFVRSGVLRAPATHRLAFRELGLAIGLHAIERWSDLSAQQAGEFVATEEEQTQLESLAGYRDLPAAIEAFWLQEEHQQADSWRDHLDINRVMLATSLAPDGYLLVG
ncbi:MAG: hypothetical protein OEV88_14365 [Gammaproteobacteria bacterium]|nr:hypothetical protein [Gammaproteobacteria bacterium]